MPPNLMPASFQSPTNFAAGSADAALALALAALADALAALLAALALALASLLAALAELAEALAADELEEPPQATSPRQHTHKMVAQRIARYFFMTLPFSRASFPCEEDTILRVGFLSQFIGVVQWPADGSIA